MRWLKPIAALAVVAALAAGTGSAFAGTPAGSARPPADPGARCERAEHVLAKLQALAERIENRIAKLEARIAGGELTPEQQARAEALLGKLEKALERLEKRIAKLEARIAEHCTEATPA
jgi:hypothetical protein